MRLTDLEPQFLIYLSDKTSKYTDNFSEADGVMFLCPKCFATNGGRVGTHAVICWFNGRGVPPDRVPGPGRWNHQGTGYHDLTFVPPNSVSIKLTSPGGCNWHGFMENGDVRTD